MPIFSLIPAGTPTQYPAISIVDATGASLTPSIVSFVRKTANESVTSSITLQNDDHLLLALLADSIYTFNALLFVDGVATGDVKIAFTVPAGSSIQWHQISPNASSTAPSNTSANLGVVATSGTSGVAAGLAGVGTLVPVRAAGIIRTGSTAGNLQLQWAQGTSDVTATTVYIDSFLEVTKRS